MFKGRLRRKDFIKNILLSMLLWLLFLIPFIGQILIYFWFIFILSICTKRLHDIGYSGYILLSYIIICWVLFVCGLVYGVNSLLSLIIIISLSLLLFLLFKDGEKGANKYGADPKEGTKLTFEEA